MDKTFLHCQRLSPSHSPWCWESTPVIVDPEICVITENKTLQKADCHVNSGCGWITADRYEQQLRKITQRECLTMLLLLLLLYLSSRWPSVVEQNELRTTSGWNSLQTTRKTTSSAAPSAFCRVLVFCMCDKSGRSSQ